MKATTEDTLIKAFGQTEIYEAVKDWLTESQVRQTNEFGKRQDDPMRQVIGLLGASAAYRLCDDLLKKIEIFRKKAEERTAEQ